MIYGFVRRYAADGRLMSMELARGNVFHPCNVSSTEADAAWHFGTRY